MAKQFKSYGSFTTNKRGGGSIFLDGWKKKGHITVWLSMTAMPVISYRHNVPTIVTWENRETRKSEVRVWSKKYVCWEPTSIIESAYKMDEKGNREFPPTKCGLCKLNAWLRVQALLRERTRKKDPPKGLDLTELLFRFRGDLAEEMVDIHVGGACNLFGWKKLPDSAKRAMRGPHVEGDKRPPYACGANKIRPSVAWKENLTAKEEYGFFVVPADNPDAGVRFAAETGGLGQKVQKALEDLMENGTDPSKTPICMRWKYKEDEPKFDDKYSVSIVREDDGRLKSPDKRILALLKGPSPEVPDDFIVPHNQITMRMALEERAKASPIKNLIPWDKLFPTRAQAASWTKEDEERRAAEKADGGGAAPSPQPTREEDESVECDECKGVIRASDPSCKHCGHKFDVDGESPPAEKKIKKKKKTPDGAAKANGAGTGGSGGSGKKAPPPTPEDAEDYPENEDDIPFLRDMTLARGMRV